MYEIGQIVLVVFNKKQQIFPMQIIETVTKKTLNGEEIKYCLQAGSDQSSQIMMDQIDGEIFVSADEARSELIARASNQINKLIDNAEQKSKLWYSSKDLRLDEEIKELNSDRKTEETLTHESDTVILSDGTVAKIKFSNS